MKLLKLALLHGCEALGLFRLTDRYYRKQLRILCYHGFSVADEHEFRPQLFISADTFRRRLRYLSHRRYPVIGLGAAVEGLQSGKNPDRAVVITVDDGFAGTLSVAVPALNAARMTATVYVTTYYVEHQVPVFRLAMQYLFWRAKRVGTSAPEAASHLPGAGMPLERRIWSLIETGERMPDEADRDRLLVQVAGALKIDIADLVRSRKLTLMNPAEVGELFRSGMDVQLHTHRHRFPVGNDTALKRELDENRSRLESMTGHSPQHLCYPSGMFDSSQWPAMEAWGVASATTCIPGLNSAATQRYALTRFLDSEAITDVEFRAEISGFLELLRSLRRMVRPDRN